MGLLHAPPGARLGNRLRTEERQLAQGSGGHVDGATIIVPIMELAELRADYESILLTIFPPKHCDRRVKALLRTCRAPSIQVPLSARNILVLIRSMARLGMVGRERFQYWKLLVRTVFLCPKQSPMAGGVCSLRMPLPQDLPGTRRSPLACSSTIGFAGTARRHLEKMTMPCSWSSIGTA